MSAIPWVLCYGLTGVLTMLITARRTERINEGDDFSPLALIPVWPMVVLIFAINWLHEQSVKLWNWYAPDPEKS